MPAVASICTSAAWCLLTLIVWAALMFLPGSTVIHQGSYACVLLLLLTLALALQLAHPAALFIVALAGLVEFVRVWVPANPTRTSPLHAGAAVLALLSCAAIAAIVNTAGERGR